MFRQQRSISSCRSLVVLASLLLSCVLVLWSCAGGGGSSSGFSGGSGGSGGGGEVLGAVTLSWDAPMQSEDGSVLSDLVGYNLYMGSQSGSYDDMFPIVVASSVEVTELSPGTYYFSITAVDSSGNESLHSNEIFTVVQ